MTKWEEGIGPGSSRWRPSQSRSKKACYFNIQEVGIGIKSGEVHESGLARGESLYVSRVNRT